MSEHPSIRIESIAHGGEGIGVSPSGKRIFVPLTAPGDLARVEVIESRSRHERGRILQLLEPGPERVEPRCMHAALCGGCHLQQLSLEGQLRAKEEAFYEALARLGDFPREAIVDAKAIVPSPNPFRYRIRCRLHFAGGELGYLRRRTHDLEPLQECHLLVPALEKLALRIRDHLQLRPIRHLAAVELCVGDDGFGAASLEPTPRAPSSWAKPAGDLLEVEGLRGVVALAPQGEASTNRRGPRTAPRPPPSIFGTPVVARDAPLAPGLRLLGRPDVFAQANAAANERLVGMAVEALGVRQGDELLELFCGAGNFTFALAAKGARVTAVEAEGVSLDLARQAYAAAATRGVNDSTRRDLPRAAEPERGRIRFISGDANLVVEGFANEGRRFDLVLLDPPRAGARGMVSALGRLGPRRIAYVSCDPATLARDMQALGAEGYVPRFACPVDMFPQTYHVEAVVILEREEMQASASHLR